MRQKEKSLILKGKGLFLSGISAFFNAKSMSTDADSSQGSTLLPAEIEVLLRAHLSQICKNAALVIFVSSAKLLRREWMIQLSRSLMYIFDPVSFQLPA